MESAAADSLGQINPRMGLLQPTDINGPSAAPTDVAISPVAPAPHLAVITDVWSWTARKYRIRATVLLIANFLLFCGLCVFTHWLHYARLFDFSIQTYLQPLRFWGPATLNLNDLVLFPISVDMTPMYGIVVGLLVASMVAVPISVAIVYRFGSAIPFILAVAIFAHMPWLAFTLLCSCILAAVRPFRMTFRYGSALLGMVPVLIYLYLATRGSSEILTASISPERKLLLAGPWLLAILAACTMLAAIIFIARLVNFRPGAVAPVMAVMFATPAILFHSSVGVDELTYRVLESEYGPRSERFEPVQDATVRILNLLHDWTRPGIEREPLRTALLAVWNARPGDITAIKHRVARPLILELLANRQAAYDACQSFIADHPRSRYIPNALFLQARALDTRLDERQLLGPAAQQELYTDFPHVQSEPVWASLLAQFPQSPLTAAARLRLAQLRLRKGDADGALAALSARELPVPAPPGASRQRVRSLLDTEPPEASLDFEPEPYQFEALRLRELIRANRDDPKYGVEPLQALATLDPHRAQYLEQLQRLAAHYPESLLYDNLCVRWASAHRDRHQRASQLRACLSAFPTGDALPEAIFQLADLEIHAFGITDPASRAAGLERLHEIVARFPDSCWSRAAAERLRIVEPQSESEPETEVEA